MHLLAPDILAEARGLSLFLCVVGLMLGLLLWLLGWWGHRFWIVMIATLTAGVVGLHAGPNFGLQRLVAGLLLAVAAGALALALVRLLAFTTGGLAVWIIVRWSAPTWDDLQGQLICLLSGGLVGLLVFRFWIMALTSLGGALLVGYSALCLADRLGKLDAAAWSEQNATMLNAAVGGAALLGFLAQFYLDRRGKGQHKDDADAAWVEQPRERSTSRRSDGASRRAG